MDKKEFEPATVKDMDKCALIYRSSSVAFIYICYHCGANFTDIDRTLQHIEFHYQLVEVTIDEEKVKSECDDFDDSTNTNLDIEIPDDPQTDTENDIKAEVMKIEKDCVADSSEKPSIVDSNRCDGSLRDHNKEKAFECKKCGKIFKREASIKTHLRQHIERGEVDWTCEKDGIREPSSIVIESPELLEKSGGSPMEVEVQPKKRQPKKTNKTAQVTSKKKEKPTRQLSTYICHKCSEAYSTANDLNDHLNSHSTSDMLQINKCTECKAYFQSAFDLRLHVLESHLSVKKFKCSTCFVEFKKKEKSLFEKHLELHLADKSANCTNKQNGICDEGKDPTSFEEITTTTETSCEVCEEKFYLKSNLDEHARCIHSAGDEEKLRCPQCETVFTKLKFYFAHQLEHRRVGAIVTETDMKVLIANFNSYIDEQSVCDAVENASNPYKCLICYTEKHSLLEIRLHVRERHVYKMLPQPIQIKLNPKERIRCHICDMAITRNSFKAHVKTHDAKKFPCSFCGRTFSKNYSKITHERMHTGEKPFQCDQCGKRFFSCSLLGAHKQSHDSTTYPCKICGRVFNIPSGYRRHIQIHRKDQTFECTICSKSFSTRVYLKRHMNKHNAKTFQCSFCENKFNTEKGKRQHEKCVHYHEPRI